jgi:spore coat polysaccharide biosynthesis protein SpsF (cytidylyltransferase family)
VIATDVNAYSPAVHMADRAYRVPLATDPGYIEALLEICKAERVSLVVPTIDDELVVFGKARERFRQIGAFAACSSAATAEACNDKYETCVRLNALGVPAARTYRPHEIAASIEFPLFIKPRVGRGAVDAHIVRDGRDLAYYLGCIDDPIVQEYLSGPEFTIDVLCDQRGRPISIVPRERVVIRSGVIDRGRTVKSRPLMELAERVCEAFVFTGALNIQCRMRGSEAAVFEINGALFRRHRPDHRGGCRLSRAARADGARPPADAAPRRVPRRPLDLQVRDGHLRAGLGARTADACRDAGAPERGGLMRSRTGLLLQARMASTRLPGKALELIEDRPLLEHCLRRLMAAGVGRVVLATTTLEEDSVLCDLATRLGVAVYRGSDTDVLDRMAGAAEAFDLDPIIRATGDNPAVDIDAAGRSLAALNGLHADYVCEDGLPYGAAVEAVTRAALMRAAREARDPDDREHVTTWIKRRADLWNLAFPAPPMPLRRPELRVTVDTPADLAYVRSLFARAGGDQPSLRALIEAAEQKREVA